MTNAKLKVPLPYLPLLDFREIPLVCAIHFFTDIVKLLEPASFLIPSNSGELKIVLFIRIFHLKCLKPLAMGSTKVSMNNLRKEPKASSRLLNDCFKVPSDGTSAKFSDVNSTLPLFCSLAFMVFCDV